MPHDSKSGVTGRLETSLLALQLREHSPSEPTRLGHAGGAKHRADVCFFSGLILCLHKCSSRQSGRLAFYRECSYLNWWIKGTSDGRQYRFFICCWKSIRVSWLIGACKAYKLAEIQMS